MVEYELTKGKGRARVNVTVNSMGSDLVVRIYNQNAHIGAVAIGDYDYEHERASVSVITRLGHKDNALAGEAAYLLSKSIRKPVCVIAGVHIDSITKEEIDEILANTKIVVGEIINGCARRKPVNQTFKNDNTFLF
ncbi:MAG: hypothetical protein JSW22_03820 [Chloroflexota bacterium]|nr:MAG: hypothetical protein JSW22_03820 [Chloroflexota bacterium]